MAGSLGITGILRAHTVSSPGGGAFLLTPAALAAAGADAAAFLSQRQHRSSAGGCGVILLESDCPRGGGRGDAGLLQKVAVACGYRFISASEGCPVAILRELGLAAPGALVASFGLGEGPAFGTGALLYALSADQLAVLAASGSFDAPAPTVYRVVCRGTLAPGVSSADVGIYLAGQFGPGGAAGVFLELVGPLVAAASEDERDTLVNAASLCGPAGLLAADDAGGDVQAVYEYDFTALTPQFAAAAEDGFVVAPLADVKIKFTTNVTIGPAPATELAAAAAVIGAARVHSDINFRVMPASRRVHFDATARGQLTALEEAGATVLPTCVLPQIEEMGREAGVVTGPCAFRVGAARGVATYYVGAAAAAAAALAGELCDPSPLFK